MKNIIIIILIGVIFYQWSISKRHSPEVIENKPQRANSPDANSVENAYHNRKSDIQVSGTGAVIKLLSDDNEGSRHQKFILRLTSGQTLLIAHNIDLAPRINSILKGDQVQFYGEYQWNSRGGVVHWTHTDPNGHHASGWLKHKGIIYQ
tara:strand:- start:216 stop:662 length:447 start_codon:yes stop_codon:yes gene_type:complete